MCRELSLAASSSASNPLLPWDDFSLTHQSLEAVDGVTAIEGGEGGFYEGTLTATLFPPIKSAIPSDRRKRIAMSETAPARLGKGSGKFSNENKETMRDTGAAGAVNIGTSQKSLAATAPVTDQRKSYSTTVSDNISRVEARRTGKFLHVI